MQLHTTIGYGWEFKEPHSFILRYFWSSGNEAKNMTFASRNPRIGAIVSVNISDADSPAIFVLVC